MANPVFAATMIYKVTIGEFTDQLHPALLPTKLWGYCAWESRVDIVQEEV